MADALINDENRKEKALELYENSIKPIIEEVKNMKELLNIIYI